MTNLFDFAIDVNIPREQKLVLDFLVECSLAMPDKFIKVDVIQANLPDLFATTSDSVSFVRIGICQVKGGVNRYGTIILD